MSKGLNKIFKRAKVNFPWVYPHNIGTEWDSAGVNNKIGRNLGPSGHRAIEEIRAAVQLIGAPHMSGMRFNDTPKGSGEWNAGQKALWRRFWLWQDWLRDEPKPREACILLAQGHRTKAIEKKIGVSQGHGYAAKHIIRGIEVYIEIMKMGDDKTATAVTIERLHARIKNS